MKNRLMSILLALFILLTFTTFFNIFHLKVSQSNTRPSSLASDVLSLSSILLQSEENLSTQSTLISSNIDLHDSISLKGPPPQRSISWKEFVKSAPLILPRQEADRMIKQWGHFDDLNYCPKKIVDVLRKPGLSNIEYEWCKWTLNPDGGKVKVGTSYGKLNSPERDKYEQLGCNSVANGNNPSCDHVSILL